VKHSKLLVAIIAFIALPVTSYIIVKRRSKKELQWYSVAYPTRKNLTQYINASGRLKAQDQITIGSLVAGRVVKLHVDDNDFVKKDQVLVELDDGIGYSAVKKAKAALQSTLSTLRYTTKFYKRQEALYQAGQVADDTFESYTKDYENAQADALQAEAELEIRSKHYDDLFIRSPEDGVIISKKVDLGQMVTARLQATELFKIAKDLTKMEAEIDIDEADIGLVKIGQNSVFTVDAFQQKPFQSKVKQVNYDYKVVDNVISYAVILDVENQELTLRPGMTTNVDIMVSKAKDALCVPNKALRVNGTLLEKIAKKEEFKFEKIEQSIETKRGDYLWILEGETFKQVPVKLGVNDGRFTEIRSATLKSGITEQNKVVIEALDPERENPVLAMGKLKV